MMAILMFWNCTLYIKEVMSRLWWSFVKLWNLLKNMFFRLEGCGYKGVSDCLVRDAQTYVMRYLTAAELWSQILWSKIFWSRFHNFIDLIKSSYSILTNFSPIKSICSICYNLFYLTTVNEKLLWKKMFELGEVVATTLCAVGQGWM